jgi:penicillin-binding protein activator
MGTDRFQWVGRMVFLATVCVLSAACASTQQHAAPPPANPAGLAATYQDPSSPGPIRGIGIEAQDLVGMTDRMARDMLANPALAGREIPPRVIVDAEYFQNESASRLNKNSITDRLRINLNRAAQGRMAFVGRHYADMVAAERDLKRQGQVDVATTRLAKAQQGGDFRLGGRITSLDSRDSSGRMSRYSQIIFEMVNLETGQIVWGGMYEFQKTAQDDVIYR